MIIEPLHINVTLYYAAQPFPVPQYYNIDVRRSVTH